MTVSTTTYTVTYTGNGSQAIFAVPFEYFTVADLVVTVDGVATSFSLQAGDPRNATSTILIGGPPAYGKAVIITRNIDLTQPAQYEQFGRYDGQSFESSMDRMTMRIQQASGGTSNHEYLSGLLGGASMQHYHLTLAQLTDLLAIFANPMTSQGIYVGPTAPAAGVTYPQWLASKTGYWAWIDTSPN